MKINKVKPYIIYKVNSKEEFSKIQSILFEQQYCWLGFSKNDQDIIIISDLTSINFPFYISNLTFTDNIKCDNINTDRYIKNEFDNIFLFIAQNKYEFNLKKLRIDKLLNIMSYD